MTDFCWTQESLTWNDVVNNPNYANFGLTPSAEGDAISVWASAGATSASPKPVTVGITDAVRLWTNGITNKGIGLKIQFGCPNRSVMFRSTEGPVAYRPRLEYLYSMQEVNVIPCYDNGYDQHYENAQSRIERELEVLRTFFGDEFNIAVNYSAPWLYTSPADVCTTANETGYCSCDGLVCYDLTEELQPGEYYRHHHTNIFANLEALYVPAPSDVRIAYQYHNFCCGTGPQCSTNEFEPVLGLGHMTERAMIIANPGDEDSETVTAIHEMLHMFGVLDHYGKNCYSTAGIQGVFPNDKYSSNCLFGENKDSMQSVDDIVICDGCRQRVDENKQLYSG